MPGEPAAIAMRAAGRSVASAFLDITEATALVTLALVRLLPHAWQSTLDLAAPDGQRRSVYSLLTSAIHLITFNL
jgi:hypothetical protein